MSESETRVWHAILYLRLSREDGDKEESNSITSQRDLLRDYLSRNPDLQEYAVRIDDGFSGASFDRPAFREMMNEIRAGKANCVIVKDLSRFGRNYLDAGEYIEKIFPFLGVRFIAVNDGYDSERERSGADFLTLPFKNLINEAYCRDISIKIRSQLAVKRKRGEFLGSFAVYGYLKSDEDRSRMVVDEYAAGVVRDIFQWKLEGASPRLIADRLNKDGVLSPVEYKRSLGMKYSTPFQSNPKARWSASGIIRLLKDRTYIGVLTQGVMTTPSYKIRKRIRRDEVEWAVIQNHHKAIVSNAVFENVQRVLAMDTRITRGAMAVQPLSGLVFCGDCGAAMVRKTVSSGGRRYVYYVCSRNKESRTACSTHCIRDLQLEELILLSVQHHMQALIDPDELRALTEDEPLKTAEAGKFQIRIDRKKTEAERLQRLLTSLYENLVDGLLDQEEYRHLKCHYEKLSTEAENQLVNLQKAFTEAQEHDSINPDWIGEYQRRHTVPALDRKTVIALIERILIYEGKRVEIMFRWREEHSCQSDDLHLGLKKEAG